jgi:hypothetical protein
VSVFLVSGRTSFDGYSPGETFETVIDPDREARAIRRGSITLIERSTPALQAGSYRLPSQHEGGKK